MKHLGLSSLAHGCLAAAALAQPCGNVWTQWWSGQAPPYRSYFSLAYDSQRQRVVMFGGISGSPLSETWEWDGSGVGSWSFRAAKGPPARFDAAMAYDSARAVTVLFGGRAGTTTFGDTWEWNGALWTQRIPAISPPARSQGLMAFDAARSRTVLTQGSSFTDTWEWDGVVWEQRASSIAAGGRSITFDASTQRVVTMGPLATLTLSEWSGSAWSIRPMTGKPSRGHLRFDPRTSRLIVVIEQGSTYVLQPGNIWGVLTNQHPGYANFYDQLPVEFDGFRMLAIGSSGQFQPLPIARGDTLVSSGPTITQLITTSGPPQPQQPFTLTAAAASNNGPILYRWHLNGAALNNGNGVTGADTPQLTIEQPGMAFNGEYSLVAADTCGSTGSPSVEVVLPCYPNCDGSNSLNGNDFVCFINRFASGDSWANCDGSTGTPTLTQNDYLCFINAYALGCP